MSFSRIVAALGAVFIGHAWAQGLGNQVNISMCNWQSVRANTIRDTVYLDGGQLWYEIGMSSGGYQYNNALSTEYAFIYTLPLNSTFDTTTTNLTSLFGMMPKSGTAANNEFPEYVDGVMFANDDEFYLYGGCLPESDLQQPADDSVLGYERYQYGAYKSSWSGGFILDATTNNNVTRYVSNGAGVSAPSEMLGFYISGMRAPDWGPIYLNPYTNVTSNKMIKVDMSTERMNNWSNLTLPDYVVGRANAEAVWVPYGDSGVVVLIGGVVQPAQIFDVTGLTSAQKNQSEEISPGFMETVAVYDVAGDNWYLQNTTGDVPPQLTQFCSVYASASDGSSQNIYIYGGFDGLNTADAPYDDAYVLSLPSFTWVKVYSGNSSHGRSGHRCVKPYPDQMLVLGGIWTPDTTDTCIDIIQVFNISSARFQNTYNPTQWSNYSIPDLVSAVIGGDSTGGATKTAPDSWFNASLADVFATKYTKTINTWYPYNTTSTTPSPSIAPAAKGSSFPSWAGAIIGVVLGLLLIAGALWFWCMRRRRNQKGGSQRMSDVSGNRFHLLQWISTAEAPRSNRAWSAADGNESNAVPQSEVAGASISPPTTVEMLGEPVHEMLDRSTAPPAELPAEVPSAFGDIPYHSPVPASRTSPGTSPRGFVSPIPENDREPESPTQPDHRRISSLSWQSINIASVVRSGSERGHTSQPSFGSGVSETSASEEAGPITGLGIEERLETTREEDGV